MSHSFEPYAPRSEAQQKRLARIASLTVGPTNNPNSEKSRTKAAGNRGAPPSLLLSALSAHSNIGIDFRNQKSNNEDNVVKSTLDFAQAICDHLTKCIEHTIPVRSDLETCIEVCQDLLERHTELLQHSGELSAAAERLQSEEIILSKKAKEISAPLKHYDAMDKMGILVGVLFKDQGNTVIRGLPKIKVDNDDFVNVLDQIDEAMVFFLNQYQELSVLHQQQQAIETNNLIAELNEHFGPPPAENSASAEDRRRERERKRVLKEYQRSLSQIPETGSVVEYFKRSKALHEAALFLIKVAVVDRINQIAQDISDALDLVKNPVSAENLEASLIYTRFHGISSRSNKLIKIVRDRVDKDPNLSYNDLLTYCQTAYAKARGKLLNLTVKAHLEQMKEQHGFINMTRLASVFLIRLCTVETMLYLDFFAGDYKADNETSVKNEKTCEADKMDVIEDTVSNTEMHLKPSYKRKKSKSEKAAIIAAQDTYFQNHLIALCTHLHKTVRRGLISLNDLDTICQIVSVLREEWSLANSSRITVPAARALGGVIQDAQERLIFCATAALQKEVHRFKPSPADLDYPNKLLKIKSNSDEKGSMDNVGESEKNNENESVKKENGVDDALEVQLRVYEAWFPPMRSVLRILSKIFRVVEPGVFEDIAQQSVQSCTKCLKESAAIILSQSGIIHADLFLVKHLLILREQLSPFDIQLRAVERQLDFSDTGKAVTKFLANRNRKLFSMTNENALVTLLREGLSVQEEAVDSKRDLEDSLRSACNDFIEHTSTTLAKSLFLFVSECKFAKANLKSLKKEPIMKVEAVMDTLSATLEGINEESDAISMQMSTYLENVATQIILMKPVARKILRALEDSKRYIAEVCEDLGEPEDEEPDDSMKNWSTDNKEQVQSFLHDIESKTKLLASPKSFMTR